MYLSKKYISRRTVIRGLGATMAVPLLDAMVPARTALAQTAAGGPVDLRVDMRVDRPIAEVIASKDYREVADLIGTDRIGVKFRYDSWSEKISQDELLGTMRLRKHSWLRRPRISPCTEMFSGPMVYWDGTVGACGCRDVNASELIIGNVNERHIADIWFGAEIQKLRDEFLTPNIRDICKSCTHYNNLSLYLRSDQKDLLATIQPRRRKGHDGDFVQATSV